MSIIKSIEEASFGMPNARWGNSYDVAKEAL